MFGFSACIKWKYLLTIGKALLPSHSRGSHCSVKSFLYLLCSVSLLLQDGLFCAR